MPLALAAVSLVAYGPARPALATDGHRARAAERAAQSVLQAATTHGGQPPVVTPDAPHASPAGAPRCRPHSPIPYLVRSHYLHHHDEHARAIRYRTEHYGFFEGFGDHSWNAHPPRFYARATRFMGLPVTVNQRIIPALECVEAEIRHACGAHPYHPHNLAGIRFHNTYRSGEITNHAYGIAVDIDPTRNTCCHCVGHWAEHPLCLRPTHSIWERMAMPECWVDAFERFGFYWLGHDTLQDTMHFEFLADPDRILGGP
ncbi:MAG: M15 family metallopeptidase [Deltaproteobacteria bacterium]